MRVHRLLLQATLHINNVRFQILTVARIKMAVFWDAAPCSTVEVYRCLFALITETESTFETSVNSYHRK
jgi:hypothetical protein